MLEECLSACNCKITTIEITIVIESSIFNVYALKLGRSLHYPQNGRKKSVRNKLSDLYGMLIIYLRSSAIMCTPLCVGRVV